MTEDTSPENLRKFLESDDPAMVRMGLSMAKGSGVPALIHQHLFAIAHWNLDVELADVASALIEDVTEEIDFGADFLIEQLEKFNYREQDWNAKSTMYDAINECDFTLLDGGKKARKILRSILDDNVCWNPPGKQENDCLIPLAARNALSRLSSSGNEEDIRRMVYCLNGATIHAEDSPDLWCEQENAWVDSVFCLIENDKDADILINVLRNLSEHDYYCLYYIMLYGIDFDAIASFSVESRIEEAGENQGIEEPHILRVKEAARKIIIENGDNPEDTTVFDVW